MTKATKIDMEKRIFTIQGWIVEGVQTSLMIKQILEKEWVTSVRQAERLIAAARKRWIQFEEGTIADRRALKVQELKQLKRGLRESYKGTPAGIRAVIAVEKEIIRLEGLDPAKKIELTGKDGGPVTVVSGTLTREEILEFSKTLEDDY